MKFYKLIIFISLFISIAFSQFSKIDINVDYSNINENEMFIFENFEEEIKNYFLNNYFFDENDDLELILDINMIIESIDYYLLFYTLVLYSQKLYIFFH